MDASAGVCAVVVVAAGIVTVAVPAVETLPNLQGIIKYSFIIFVFTHNYHKDLWLFENQG